MTERALAHMLAATADIALEGVSLHSDGSTAGVARHALDYNFIPDRRCTAPAMRRIQCVSSSLSSSGQPIEIVGSAAPRGHTGTTSDTARGIAFVPSCRSNVTGAPRATSSWELTTGGEAAPATACEAVSAGLANMFPLG